MSNDPLAMLGAFDPHAFLGLSAQFPSNSRYYGLEVVQISASDGRAIAYLRRRFAPQPEALTTVLEHRVVEGERLDQLAARYLGDPEQFWRICDANAAFVPTDLTDAHGRTLRIALPQGFPAPSGHA